MIPGKIIRFLDHANVAFAGTRDRDLVPHGHKVSGWRVGADQRTMTAYIGEEFTPGLVERLRENGELAVTVEEFPSHETYQFKGRYLSDRPLGQDDMEIVERIRRRFVRNVRTMYTDIPEPVLMAFTANASVAVEFEVLEVYLQTPGPGAGTRLVPPAES